MFFFLIIEWLSFSEWMKIWVSTVQHCQHVINLRENYQKVEGVFVRIWKTMRKRLSVGLFTRKVEWVGVADLLSKVKSFPSLLDFILVTLSAFSSITFPTCKLALVVLEIRDYHKALHVKNTDTLSIEKMQ